MVNSFLEFKADIEADAGRTYLVLTKEDLATPQLLEFQIAMIAQNDIPGVIKMEVKAIDSDIKLCYPLNGLISLANYLKRQRISKSEFTEILDTIISVLLRCGNYLLNDNSIVLKEDFIYIDPKSKQISLVYLPVETECAVTEEFKSFMIKLLINTATIDTKDNYVQLLLNQGKSEQFSLVEFRKQLSIITGDDATQSKEDIQEKALPGHQTSYFIADLAEQTSAAAADPGPKPNLRKTVFIILAIISVICAVISTRPFEFRALLTQPDKATYIVFGLSLAGLLALIAVLSLAQKNKAPLAAGTIASPETPVQIENRSFTENNLFPVISDKEAVVGVTLLIEEEANDETTFLEKTLAETTLISDCNYPHLVPVGGEDFIIINKDEFRVGRQKGITDFVIPSKNIGRIHAQIDCCENNYYITDKDSTNGTFINGSRILSNKQYLLKNNDKVMFANLEYLFICS